MNIKINDFSPLSHKLRLEIVEIYCKRFETSSQEDVSFFGLMTNYTLKETGKYPIKLEVGSRNYHVKCRKTKTSYVFDIWLAS